MIEKTDRSPENLLVTDEDEILTEQEPVRFVLSLKEGGERLDKILARRLSRYSRSRIQKWIADGHVTVDGKPAVARQNMVGDETVMVWPQQAEEELAFTPEPVDFPVVFEDKALVVVDKPAGLVVHPAAGNWSKTLLNGILHRFPGHGMSGGNILRWCGEKRRHRVRSTSLLGDIRETGCGWLSCRPRPASRP